MITENFRQLCLYSFSVFFFHREWKYFYRKITFTLLNVFLENGSGKRKEYSKPERRNGIFWGHFLNSILAFLCMFSQPALSSLYLLHTWKSVSAVHRSYYEMKFILCFCVCCHLPIHISLNQLRYLSGFTRSFKVKTENWRTWKCHQGFPILTTLPLGNPKYGGSVCNCCLNHDNGLRSQSQVCNPRITQSAVGCVPGSSTSHLSTALAPGLAPLQATYSCSPPPLGCSIAVTWTENATGLQELFLLSWVSFLKWISFLSIAELHLAELRRWCKCERVA